MTPLQKIKYIILELLTEHNDVDYVISSIHVGNVDDIYDEQQSDKIYEVKSELRHGQFETNIPCDYSRHYETRSVAAKTYTGEWVGWTYWYGGGKHAEPEAIDWMSDAYDLDVTEKEELVVVRTFKKIDP